MNNKKTKINNCFGCGGVEYPIITGHTYCWECEKCKPKKKKTDTTIVSFEIPKDEINDFGHYVMKAFDDLCIHDGAAVNINGTKYINIEYKSAEQIQEAIDKIRK